MPKPNGKCFTKNCEDCNWWVDKEMEKVENGRPIGVKYMKKVCEFRVMFDFLHTIAGSIDGVQGAINDTQNITLKFGRACAAAFLQIQEQNNNKKIK